MTLSSSQVEYLEELFELGRSTFTNDSGSRDVFNKWEQNFLERVGSRCHVKDAAGERWREGVLVDAQIFLDEKKDRKTA